MKTLYSLASCVILILAATGCGDSNDKKSTGPTDPGVQDADYAIMAMIFSGGEAGMAKPAQTPYIGAMVSVFRNPGDNANVDDWPMQQATDVKLIGAREIPLQEMSFGDYFYYYTPEDQPLAPGETYRLRLTIDGRTVTSTKTATAMEPLRITTEDYQVIDVGQSFEVAWTNVAHTAGYAVAVAYWDEDSWDDEPDSETVILVGMNTRHALSGSLFDQDGEYGINVIAYGESIAPQIANWEHWAHDIPPVYEFDDSRILGTFFAVSSDEITLYVGEEGDDWDDRDDWDDWDDHDDWDDWNDDHFDNGPTGQIPVTVSSGTQPEISWSGGNIMMLMVLADGSDGEMWYLLSTTGLSSPITYGNVPAGAMEMVPARPLTPGTRYQVIVVGEEGEVGMAMFTP